MIHKSVVEKSQGAIKPHEVGQLTFAEVCWYLEDSKNRGGGGGGDMSDAELAAEVERWRRMSPAEKLRDYKRF